MVTIDNKNYVKIGDKMALVDHLDANGNPVISTWSEEKVNENGGTDCTIHVNVLQIAGEQKKL